MPLRPPCHSRSRPLRPRRFFVFVCVSARFRAPHDPGRSGHGCISPLPCPAVAPARLRPRPVYSPCGVGLTKKQKKVRNGGEGPIQACHSFFRDDLLLMWEQRRLRGSLLSKLCDVFTRRFVVSVSVVSKPRFESTGGFPLRCVVRENIEKYWNVFLQPSCFVCFLFYCNGSIS